MDSGYPSLRPPAPAALPGVPPTTPPAPPVEDPFGRRPRKESPGRDLRKRIQTVTPKVQVRIQGDQLRVVSKDKDSLQLVIKALREADDIPVPLQFTNYR